MSGLEVAGPDCAAPIILRRALGPMTAAVRGRCRLCSIGNYRASTGGHTVDTRPPHSTNLKRALSRLPSAVTVWVESSQSDIAMVESGGPEHPRLGRSPEGRTVRWLGKMNVRNASESRLRLNA